MNHEPPRLDALRRYWKAIGVDAEVSHAIYHSDAILEFPQSQERFVGLENFKAWRKKYPAALEFRVRRIMGHGDLWISEISIQYDAGPPQFGCSIMEFRGDKVARETIYLGQGWEAPEWRAPWRSVWTEDGTPT